MLFEAGGTKTVQDYYQVERAGDYSIRVLTVLPNNQAGEGVFQVTCTP